MPWSAGLPSTHSHNHYYYVHTAVDTTARQQHLRHQATLTCASLQTLCLHLHNGLLRHNNLHNWHGMQQETAM